MTISVVGSDQNNLRQVKNNKISQFSLLEDYKKSKRIEYLFF